jgi:hypothetical protein
MARVPQSALEKYFSSVTECHKIIQDQIEFVKTTTKDWDSLTYPQCDELVNAVFAEPSFQDCPYSERDWGESLVGYNSIY